ncbi:MAG: cobyrinate a,c-diamide synthase [Campylobacterales bacterium]
MKAICISAVASNQGKTILTMALLHHFKNSVRPFKIGPDYIDPLFHQKISDTPSINLDTFMMSKKQVKWIFQKYSDKDISICEGVSGFYDGMDRGCSAYGVSKLLNIPTILLLDGSSSYITVSAVLKGLVSYRDNNTIKAVVLNRLSSEHHFNLIKNQIEKDFSNIVVLGWIQKNLPSLKNTHLGLDITDMSFIKNISDEVLKHIDLKALNKIAKEFKLKKVKKYPFKKVPKQNKKLAIVNDENFSFLYHDNLKFLQKTFKKVVIVNSTKDEKIPKDADIVYIVGGYVETPHHYNNIKHSNRFKTSLIKHSKTKPIYAECAGLLYLAKKVDDKPMSGILDLEFTLKGRFQRMGYYYASSDNSKGHSFHYTNIKDKVDGVDILSKQKQGSGEIGSWQKNKIFGTYLHSMLRGNAKLIKKRFL